MSTVTSLENKNIYFLNGKNIISNINNISKVNRNEGGYLDNSLKTNLFNVLNKLQKVDIPFKDDDIIVKFDDPAIINHLINKKVINEEDIIDNKHLFDATEQANIYENINKALKLLKMIHNDLSYLINQLTGTILCFKKKGTGGGTTSCALGLIWLNPHEDWTIIDYAEALYHEFTHTSIFIDDMVNKMFINVHDCKKEEAYVTSAILKIKRPLDSAYHAAGVAVALMHFYFMIGDKNKALSFKKPLSITINELLEKDEYLGVRGVESLQGMSYFISSLDYKTIQSSLKV